MNTTVSALKKLLREQQEKGINSNREDIVFGRFTTWIVKQAKVRKPIQDKKNYVEKIDASSAPMQAFDHVQALENFLFQKGVTRNCCPRTIFASLRDRMLFLFTTNGVLRGDTVFKSELSDLFHVNVQKHSDPHPFTIFIMQFATGKTNNGIKLYGRVGRHADVSSCAIGSVAFYLFYRFSVTGEFDEQDAVDFFHNNSWFDMKFITEIRSQDRNKIISTCTYYNAIKTACHKLGIITKHYVHLGRVAGSILSEINEDGNEDLRILGNWDPKIQEKSYSNKLPMRILRRKAGLCQANEMNYNPRVAFEVPQELLDQVFPWVPEAKKPFEVDAPPADKVTAQNRLTAGAFLAMMEQLRSVVIQDAAAMIIESPDRASHGLFQLPLFRSEAFTKYTSEMKEYLDSCDAPWDASLEHVLPGLNLKLEANNTNVNLVGMGVRSIKKKQIDLESGQRKIQLKVAGIEKQIPEVASLVLEELFANLSAAFKKNKQRRYLNSSPSPDTAQTPPETPPETMTTETRGTAETMEDRSAFTQLTSQQKETKKTKTRLAIPCVGMDYRLPIKPRSATDMWNSWHAVGTYKDKPVAGGIPVLEKQGTRWRKSYTGSEKKMFSRWKISMDLLNEEIDLYGIHILNELDSTFKSVSTLEKQLKENKKMRERISKQLAQAPLEFRKRSLEDPSESPPRKKPRIATL